MNAGRLDVERELAALSGMDVLQQPYVNAAYATGSLLAGFGTPTSDLDVILLVASSADKDLAMRDGAIKRHELPRADFEVFTVDEFAEAVGSCADFRIVWNAGRLFTIAKALRLVSQFTAAVQVLKPSAELAEFGRRIAEQRAALIQLSVVRAAILGNHTNEALLGLISVKDEVGVLRRSHDYLEFGLDAWCTARGAIYPDEKSKWLWHRLNLVSPGERELASLRALYVPEVVTQPMPDVVRRRMDTTQALLAQALLAAWAPNPQACQVPVLPQWAAPGGTLWRSRNWMPTRTPDAWGLGTEFRFFEMPVTAVMAWACAGGRTRTELETIVVDRCRSAFGTDVQPATARSVIAKLLVRGALRVGGSTAAARNQTA